MLVIFTIVKMIYVYQDQINDAAIPASINKSLGSPYYLWSMTHKLSGQQFRFIPYHIPPCVTYKVSYDLFNFDIDDSIPQVLTGATMTGQTNVHLIPGEYFLKVYEQTSPSNLNPTLAYNVVNETLVNVVGTNANNPVSYSGNSDVFIIYNDNND